MMLGVTGLMGASGDGGESGGASGGSSEVGASSSVPGGGPLEESGGGVGGGGGGIRWPRQETLALLKIRSEMDVVFRDSSLKGPLWEEVSRKMAELGFQRSAKKCKEKFENVYKYHKRTKDGRASKSDGKTYRFFDQLEALENTTTPPPPQPPPRPMAAPPMPVNATTLPMPSSSSPSPLSMVPPIQTSSFQLQPSPSAATGINASNPPQSHMNFQPQSLHLHSTSSSSTSSDEDIQRRGGKKRKWKDFFQRVMKDVIHKQEELQKKFLDTLERRERDRMTREEAWRVQEMARMNRERELLAEERSIAAAKDAAVIAFLQKVTEQNNLQIPIFNNAPPLPPPPMQVQLSENVQPQPPPPPPKPVAATPVAMRTIQTLKTDNGGGDSSMSASSSRWPKAEVEALIKLRTTLDAKYQENGPKGPFWEEISTAMSKLGYNRNSKRCKEKWENINKYFKKVKESNKKRPEDSKTCPYFHQLDAIYKEKAKNDVGPSSAQGYTANPDSDPMVPIMARPENQWPLSDQPNSNQEIDSENNDDDEDDEEEDEGGGYEIVANKQQQSNPAE